MQTNDLPVNKHVFSLVLRLYFLLAVIQGLVALVIISLAKSEESSHFIFGLSSTRVIIGLIILVITVISAILLIETWIHPVRFFNRITGLFQFLFQPKFYWGVILVFGGLILLGSYFITLVPDTSEPFTRGIFDRLLPVAIWITGLSIQTIISIIILHKGEIYFGHRPKGKAFYLIIALLSGIFLSWSLIMKAIHSMEYKITGWNSMGVPILEYQLLLAWCAGIALLAALFLVTKKLDHSPHYKKLTPPRIDLIIGLLLWLSAVVVWESVPLTPSWFISAPTIPNFESYPTSDARAYDVVAQTALIGEGYLWYNDTIIKRPLHALYITTMRLIGGQDYNLFSFLQILVLAFFPVLVFYLTNTLHNRISGVIAGIMIILREANSIVGAGIITTSHAKLIMVDLPMALMNVVFILLVIHWLKEIEQRKLYALISGAALGLSMMVRLESFVFFFPLTIILMLILFPKKKYLLWMKSVLLFLIGITLIISPWIWRNWRVSGIVYFDSPYIRYNLIGQRFRAVATTSPEVTSTVASSPIPTSPLIETLGTSTPQAVSPITPAVPTKLPLSDEERVSATVKQTVSYIKDNPMQLFGFFLAHYLNSQIQTFLIMPSTFRLLESSTSFLGHHSLDVFREECCSLDNYIRRMPYWHNWDGSFPNQSIIPLVINMLILATGFYITWRRYRLIGATPLILSTTYLLFNAVFRNSGGRYILPVDWTTVVYFSIGLAHLSTNIIESFTRSSISENLFVFPKHPVSSRKPEYLITSPKLYITIVGIFLFAWTIPIVERSFPQIYTEIRKQDMVRALYKSDLITASEQKDLQNFQSHGGLVYAGRALYPQYYRANRGGIGDKSSPQSPKPYSRLIFYLIGQYNSTLIMPIPEKPKSLPNSSDVLVFMCPEKDVLAISVFEPSGDPESIWFNSSCPSHLVCPIPLPEENQ